MQDVRRKKKISKTITEYYIDLLAQLPKHDSNDDDDGWSPRSITPTGTAFSVCRETNALEVKR